MDKSTIIPVHIYNNLKKNQVTIQVAIISGEGRVYNAIFMPVQYLQYARLMPDLSFIIYSLSLFSLAICLSLSLSGVARGGAKGAMAPPKLLLNVFFL